MCGRYGFSVKNPQALLDWFDLINTRDEIEKLEIRYNIAPGQTNPVIIHTAEGRKLVPMRWGLIPFWAKDESGSYKTINARAEGIENKPAYRKPLRFQRCLVPATNFYEWDKSRKPSQPHLFKVKEHAVFSFAGLFDQWVDKTTGKEIYNYTIITTQPNNTVNRIHNRMPVILKKEDEEEWLNPDNTEPEKLLLMLMPYPDEDMHAYPISRAVNIPTNDTKELTAPLQEQAHILFE